MPSIRKQSLLRDGQRDHEQKGLDKNKPKGGETMIEGEND